MYNLSQSTVHDFHETRIPRVSLISDEHLGQGTSNWVGLLLRNERPWDVGWL